MIHCLQTVGTALLGIRWERGMSASAVMCCEQNKDNISFSGLCGFPGGSVVLFSVT